MTDISVNQVAAVALSQKLSEPQVNQIAIVAVTEIGSANTIPFVDQIAVVTPVTVRTESISIVQLVSIAVAEGPRVRVQQLDTVFKPPCYVPCLPVGARRY